MCAYAQAVSCAYLGEKLFPEDVEMWKHGTVVREVYTVYKDYASDPIPAPPLDLSPFTLTQRLVLAGVNAHYAEVYEAVGLCIQSHKDFPKEFIGTNHILTVGKLKSAVQGSKILQQLQDASRPFIKPDSFKAVPAEDFLNALAY